MNPHKISAHSDNKQKSYGMLLIELVTWGVTNRDVLLLATIRYVVCLQLWSYTHLSQQEVDFGPNLTKYNCVCISFHLFRNGPLTNTNIRFFQVNFSCHKLIFLKYWTRVLLNYFHFCNTLLSKHEPSFFRLQRKINRNLIKTAVG